MIEIQNLSHSIGSSSILSDVSVSIPAQKVTALIGPNGAGKSTLLNLVSRQDDIQTGKILFQGNDLTKIDQRDLAKRMAVVAQQVGVASRLKVRELIGFGRWPQNNGRPTQHDHNIIESALVQFELVDLADRFLDEISGGQRQRAFVAMAYVQDTDWLLLDEPLNNLDLSHAKTLMRELNRIATKDRKSIVIVLHDLNYTIRWADHIIALKNGKIVADGPTPEVATTQTLSQLYETEVEVSQLNGAPIVSYHR